MTTWMKGCPLYLSIFNFSRYAVRQAISPCQDIIHSMFNPNKCYARKTEIEPGDVKEVGQTAYDVHIWGPLVLN